MSLYEILPPEIPANWFARLEAGDVIVLPHFGVVAEADERDLFTPAILASAKSASFDPRSGRLSGTTLQGARAERLVSLMRRFTESAAALVDRLFPRDAGRVGRARASFRPAEIAGRETSWRKDDTRLHVDSFPAVWAIASKRSRRGSCRGFECRGTTWLAFTDEVVHAAMSGQYQPEQTFLLPVDAMLHPERSPLRILERLKGKALV